MTADNIRGALVAAEAREWIGTPFVWQASQKGVGCDCKGLVWGVARELGFPEASTFYARVANYAQNKPVPSALLKEGMAAVFDPVRGEPGLGDVLLLKIGQPPVHPAHLAIVSGDDRAIHAQLSGSREWVKETRLAALLKLNPLHSAWRWRDGS